MRRAPRWRWPGTAVLGFLAMAPRRTAGVATRAPGPAADAGDPVDAIAASGSFSPAFYSRTARVDGGLRALISHYLAQPIEARIPPSPVFDPAFYAAAYPDAVPKGADPFLHYALQGSREQRYPSLRRAEEDARAIKASGLFDEASYRAARPDRPGHSDIVLDYLIHGSLDGARPNRNFDEAFVLRYYAALRRGTHNAFAFICRNRMRPWCHQNRRTLLAVMKGIKGSRRFDRAFYRERYLADRPGLDELTHYCTEGYMLGLDPSEGFSTDEYFRAYRDVLRAEENPLLHYERHGKAEGRVAGLRSAVPVENGGRQPDPEKPWVLIVSHEASLTGAPIVGLKLAEHMSGSANVVAWVGREGPLSERFRDASVLFVPTFGGPADRHGIVARMIQVHPIEFAVVNSVVSGAAMPALIDADVPIVSLVHEFAEYVRPAGFVSSVVLNATKAVVPARVVGASLAKELRELRVSDQPANVVVRAQGRCELEAKDDKSSLSFEQILARLGIADAESRPPVVLGCGFVQIRKGVDLFIETARQAKAALPEVTFVWVGGGYRPKEDMAYSAFLADQIERSGLAGSVHFFGEQADLEPFWRLADVFLLSSRLDPFPNVALDAIVEGLPLVCFEGASGIAELAGRVPDSVFSVPYQDTGKASETIVMLCRNARERRRTLAGKRPDREAAFSIDDYADALLAIGREARREHDGHLADARRLHEDGLFDAAFFQDGLPDWVETAAPLPYRRASDLAKLYVRLRAAGVEMARPFPGAVSRPAILEREPAARDVHVDDIAVARGPGMRRQRTTEERRPLLHVHLAAMPDAATLDALRGCAAACDVLMTTDLPGIARELAERGETGSPRLRASAHPNWSDPLTSFLQAARTERPSILGHLRLPHPDDEIFGRGRLARALDLYGSPERRNQALDFFDADPKLGLVFPEQAAMRGSSGAEAVAAALAKGAGLMPRQAPARWPLDLVFWMHLGRVPGLMSDDLLEATKRGAVAFALQDRLDGFGRFLPMLCEAGGCSCLAVLDPDERPGDGGPLILPS